MARPDSLDLSHPQQTFSIIKTARSTFTKTAAPPTAKRTAESSILSNEIGIGPQTDWPFFELRGSNVRS